MIAYTDKEKAEVLNKAYLSKEEDDDLCHIGNEKEQNIIDEDLEPKGLIKVWGRFITGYDCEITEKGLTFLRSGYNRIEQERQKRKEIEEMENDNVVLKNKSLKRELSLKWLRIIAAIVTIIGGIIAILNH